MPTLVRGRVASGLSQYCDSKEGVKHVSGQICAKGNAASEICETEISQVIQVLGSRPNVYYRRLKMDFFVFKGKLRSKKSQTQIKSVKKCKKRAITDFNAPNGSRDIPF